MYGKIFASIYDGTLRADWKALITFQQMIVLCDQNGVVDMTAHALHGRTGIPLDIIEHGIQKLEEPDPYSRSTDNDGRRILRLEDHRSWGWRIVNYGYYRTLASAEEKRNRDKERIANNRKATKGDMSQPVADCSNVSQPVADVAQVEVEVKAKVEAKKKEEDCSKPVAKTATAVEPTPEQIEIYIPTNHNGHEFPILKTKVKEWSDTYPGVDVPRTLKEIRQWSVDNPSKRKTGRGMHSFIGRWMAREQNGGRYG